MSRFSALFYVAVGLTLWLAVGCTGKKVPQAGTEVTPQPYETLTPTPEPTPTATPGEGGIHEEDERPVGERLALRDVLFAFDEALLNRSARQVLEENLRYLEARPGLRVVLEGHCDERGGRDYNLALGERRARAVYDYLRYKGIASERLQPISYGQERPLDPRSSEEAWQKNRRVHFREVTAP
jgi:peptidoglycan-associated lipoprotein